MFEPSISSTFEQIPEIPRPRGVTSGQATHPGHLRENNEDHLAVASDIGVFIVTDGVGGAPAGAVAARLATAAMLHSLRGGPSGAEIPDAPAREPRGSAEMHGPRLIAAALRAHTMIHDFAARNRCHGAATTMAALWVTRDHVHVANTGDSRVYRLCAGGLEQLTKDHTVAQELADGDSPAGRKWMRQMENVVTQVLGGRSGRPPAVHLVSRALSEREVFLLCTDGLTKMVGDADIASVLRRASSPQEAAGALVDLANEAGGLDNTTCIVVHVEPERDSSPSSRAAG